MVLDENSHIKAKQRFITIEEECNKVHNNKYDYSIFIYKNLDTKSTIICPLHSTFEQKLSHHLNGQECPKCARLSVVEKLKMTEEKFKEMLYKKHPNITCILYKSYKVKANYICDKHPETIITSTPTAILRQEHGCLRCCSEETSKSRTLSNITFQAKLANKHNGNITTTDEYKGTKTPLDFTCVRHGTTFQSTPFNVLQGRGCTICGGLLKYRKYLEEPTILYYIYLEDYNLYKIGITIQRVGIRQRMYGIKNYKVLNTFIFKLGSDAYEAEQQILKDYKHLKYTGDKIMHSGNKELFISPLFKDSKISNLYLLKAEQWLKTLYN